VRQKRRPSEDVILLPWGVKLPARIDTRAAKSSLYALDLRIQDNIAEFRLPEKYGGLKMRLPVVEWKHLRTKEGLTIPLTLNRNRDNHPENGWILSMKGKGLFPVSFRDWAQGSLFVTPPFPIRN